MSYRPTYILCYRIKKKQNIVENVIQITEFTSLYSGEYENRVVSDVRISVYTVQSVVINDNNCLMQSQSVRWYECNTYGLPGGRVICKTYHKKCSARQHVTSYHINNIRA